jgi:hypothetical protein
LMLDGPDKFFAGRDLCPEKSVPDAIDQYLDNLDGFSCTNEKKLQEGHPKFPDGGKALLCLKRNCLFRIRGDVS